MIIGQKREANFTTAAVMLILHLLIAELASDGKTKQKYDGVFLSADLYLLYLLLESGASLTAP